MAPCKTCRLQPTALPDYYYATTCFDIFYLITLLHAYLITISAHLCAFPCHTKKKWFIYLAYGHLTTSMHYLSHGLHDYIEGAAIEKCGRLFFFLISRHWCATTHFDTAVYGEANVKWEKTKECGKQISTGKYIFREKISCVNPIVEHFFFTV